jgi:hypothetical protein
MRKKLVMALVYAMRTAENYYLNTGNNIAKVILCKLIEDIKLRKSVQVLLKKELINLGLLK